MLRTELKRDVRAWRDDNPKIDSLACLMWRLTEAQLEELAGDISYSGPTDSSTMRVFGIRVVVCTQMPFSGLFYSGGATRIAGPYSERTETARLNTTTTVVDGIDKWGHLSDQQIAELITWFKSLASATKPSEVLRPPSFYESTIAWIQLSGMDMVGTDSYIKPWNMPRPMAAFYSDVWYASRVSIVAAHVRDAYNALTDVANGK